MEFKELLEKSGLPVVLESDLKDLHADDSVALVAWEGKNNGKVNTLVFGDSGRISEPIAWMIFVLFHNISPDEFASDDMMEGLFDYIDEMRDMTKTFIKDESDWRGVAVKVSDEIPIAAGKKVGSYTEIYVEKRALRVRNDMQKEMGKDIKYFISACKDHSASIYCSSALSADEYKEHVLRVAANAILACDAHADIDEIFAHVSLLIGRELNPEYMDVIDSEDEE